MCGVYKIMGVCVARNQVPVYSFPVNHEQKICIDTDFYQICSFIDSDCNNLGPDLNNTNFAR